MQVPRAVDLGLEGRSKLVTLFFLLFSMLTVVTHRPNRGAYPKVNLSWGMVSYWIYSIVWMTQLILICLKGLRILPAAGKGVVLEPQL